jgi:NAD-dependent deacetylase
MNLRILSTQVVAVDVDELIKDAARILVRSNYAIVFTGAGVSTESGIPDFRGPQGLWKRVDPEKFTINYFISNPDEVWGMFIEYFMVHEDVRPNPAHYAIAELERLGIVKSVITQNVDGLHQMAGSKRVIELHGNLREAVCMNCGYRLSLKEAIEIFRKTGSAPRCPRCGGLLKPDVVFFGEPLPYGALKAAFEEAEKADVVLVVGSSLVVTPAAYVPLRAKERGAKMVIVNLEETTMDHIADVVIRGKAGEVVPKIVEMVKKFMSQS